MEVVFGKNKLWIKKCLDVCGWGLCMRGLGVSFCIKVVSSYRMFFKYWIGLSLISIIIKIMKEYNKFVIFFLIYYIFFIVIN